MRDGTLPAHAPLRAPLRRVVLLDWLRSDARCTPPQRFAHNAGVCFPADGVAGGRAVSMETHEHHWSADGWAWALVVSCGTAEPWAVSGGTCGHLPSDSAAQAVQTTGTSVPYTTARAPGNTALLRVALSPGARIARLTGLALWEPFHPAGARGCPQIRGSVGAMRSRPSSAMALRLEWRCGRFLRWRSGLASAGGTQRQPSRRTR